MFDVLSSYGVYVGDEAKRRALTMKICKEPEHVLLDEAVIERLMTMGTGFKNKALYLVRLFEDPSSWRPQVRRMAGTSPHNQATRLTTKIERERFRHKIYFEALHKMMTPQALSEHLQIPIETVMREMEAFMKDNDTMKVPIGFASVESLKKYKQVDPTSPRIGHSVTTGGIRGMLSRGSESSLSK